MNSKPSALAQCIRSLLAWGELRAVPVSLIPAKGEEPVRKKGVTTLVEDRKQG